MIDWIKMGRKTLDLKCDLWQDLADRFGLYKEDAEVIK